MKFKIYLSLFIALMFLFSRGFFEMYFPKSIAYLIEFFGFLIFIAVFIKSTKFNLRIKKYPFFLIGIFLTMSILSMIITGNTDYVIYMIFPIAISLFFISFNSIHLNNIDMVKVQNTATLVFYILFIIAIWQQLGLDLLPGLTWTFGTFIRPSSLSGSYLHYPLIAVLLGVFIHSINRKMNIHVSLAYLSPFTAFSRSGMLLVLLIMTFYTFKNSIKNIYVILKVIPIILLLLLIFYFILEFLELSNFVIERFFSMFNLDSAGNDNRIVVWKYGIELFSNTNLILGEHFGEITNLTRNLSSGNSYVVESSLLQNLINFGLLATMAFYAIIMYTRTKIYSIWNMFILSFAIQSFIYQSIEVFPFIIGIFLFSSVLKSKELLIRNKTCLYQ